MARPSKIEVEIGYRLRGETGWRVLRPAPEDYFWHDPEDPDAEWEVDSPSEHAQSLGYLPDGVLQRVEFVRHAASNPVTGARQDCFYHVWAGGDSFSCHVRTRLPGESPREELVIANALPFEENCSETLRFDLAGGEARLVMNWIGYGAGGDEHGIHVFPERE